MLRELGELGSVTAAAEALMVTPSAISQQLRLLQRSVPVPLTEREGRRLVLTPAGRALAGAALEVEVALARARQSVEEYLGRADGPVSVAAFHSAASAFLPYLARHAGTGGPPVTFADEDVAQHEFPPLTRDHDIVIAHRLDHTAHWPSTVTTTALLHEPLDVALPAGHRLTSASRVTPADVSGERWITVHDGFPLMATIEAIAAAAGRPLDIAHRINEFNVVTEVVAAGGGIALVPRWTVRTHPEVILKPLTGVHAHRHIDALHRPEHTARAAVRTVLTRLRAAAATISGEDPGAPTT